MNKFKKKIVSLGWGGQRSEQSKIVSYFFERYATALKIIYLKSP